MVRKALFLICVFFISAEASPAQFGGQNQDRTRREGRGGFADPDVLEISGRVLADSTADLQHPIAVRLEGSASEVFDTAFTDGAGNFSFRVTRGPIYYVAVTVEGFEPARERIGLVPFGNSSIPATIVLRRSAIVRSERPASTDGDDPNTVDLRQLEANIPDEARDEFTKALEDLRRSNHRRAAERLERAIELAPEFYEAHNGLGVAYTRLGRYREAEAVLARALELNPNGAQPLINLGSMHLQEGESQAAAGEDAQAWISFERAVEVLNRAVEANARSAPAHYYLGAALYKVAYYRRAETSLSRALELDPRLYDVRLMLSNVYIVQERLDDALAQLDLYLEENPRSPQRDNVEKMKRQIEGMLREGR